MQRLHDLILKYPNWACLIAGAGTALAFLTHPFFPALALIGVLVIVLNDETRPNRAALRAFLYAMGFFTAALYWIQYAFAISIGDFLWARALAMFGLPLILSPFW